MQINPGALNKRIDIVQPSMVTDAEGYPLLTDTVVHTCYAQFTRRSGTEINRDNADFGTEKCRFLIRHTGKSITRKMYVRYAGVKYPIVYVNDYGDGRAYIELWCEAETPGVDL